MEENKITVNNNEEVKVEEPKVVEENKVAENSTKEEASNQSDFNEAINGEKKKEPLTKWEKAKKIIYYVFMGILCFFIACAAWISFQKFVLKSSAPKLFGVSAFVVESPSMQGTIDVGDMVLVKKQDKYIIGDIITFFEEGNTNTTPITHRIVGYHYNNEGVRDGFITKGDYNDSKDPTTVYPDYIIGGVFKNIENVETFGVWLKDSGGFIYIVLAIVIVGGGLYVLKKETN